MGISDGRQREKKQRKTEFTDAAERLFFSRGYEDVSMDDIALKVELNKATLYLYPRSRYVLSLRIISGSGL